MKSNLLTLAILLNIVFVVRETSSKHNDWHPATVNANTWSTRRRPTRTPRLESNTQDVTTPVLYTTEDPNINPYPTEDPNNNYITTTEDPNNNDITTTEDPNNNDITTTENAIDASTPKEGTNVRDCPQNQSSFSKPDLIKIIDYFSDVNFNILANLSDAYHDTAIHARDEVLKEFDDFKAKFVDRPNHLNHILEDIEETRQNQIVPLVNKAASTLQEYHVVEQRFQILYNETTKMLDNLERLKKICDLNNCKQLLRSYFLSEVNDAIVLKPKDDEYMCSTINNVHETVLKRLSSFAQEEVERLKKYIINNKELLTEAIALLKKRLREAAINEFGPTMYEILDLNDEHVHFMKLLIDFNKQSSTSTLKKQNLDIDYLLTDLNDKIEKYRYYCLHCGQAQRRRRQAEIEMNVETIETIPDKHESSILDQLIDDKIIEIKNFIQSDLEDIFKKVNDIVNNDEIIVKTVAELKPIQESVSARVKQEKQALESLIEYVPKESLEHAQEVYHQSEELINSINNGLNFFTNTH